LDLSKPPKGFKVIRMSRSLGSGEACYRRASEALLSWNMHKGSPTSGVIIVDPHPVLLGEKTPRVSHTHHRQPNGHEPTHREHHRRSSGPNGGGGLVFTFARSAPGIWSLNPCRITHQICDRSLRPSSSGFLSKGLFSSVGYATLEGHWLQGAEVMTVRFEDFDQRHGAIPDSNRGGLVTFELASISRGRRGVLGHLLFRLVAKTQHKFFKDQIDSMVRISCA